MSKLFICLAFILLLFAAGAQAQKNYATTVQVQVISSKDTPPNDMKTEIEKELASFVDVSIKEKEADFSVIVFLEKIPSNGPAFFAVTFSYYKGAECSYKNAIVDGKVQRTDCRSLAQLSTIGFIAEADIKAKAKEIVSSFNKAIIDPDRKAFAKNKSF